MEEGYCGFCNDWTAGEANPEPGNTYRDGKVHVMAEECVNCLFHPKTRLVTAKRVAGIVADTKDEPGATFTCHVANLEGRDAICRGWFDHFGDRDPIINIAKGMGVIEFQEPST